MAPRATADKFSSVNAPLTTLTVPQVLRLHALTEQELELLASAAPRKSEWAIGVLSGAVPGLIGAVAEMLRGQLPPPTDTASAVIALIALGFAIASFQSERGVRKNRATFIEELRTRDARQMMPTSPPTKP
jgi:hypothetical protein